MHGLSHTHTLDKTNSFERDQNLTKRESHINIILYRQKQREWRLAHSERGQKIKINAQDSNMRQS